MAKKAAPTPEMLVEARKNIMRYIAFSNCKDYDMLGEYAWHRQYRKKDITPCSEYYKEKGWLKGDTIRISYWNGNTTVDPIHQCGLIAITSLEEAKRINNFAMTASTIRTWKLDVDFIFLSQALNAYCRMRPSTIAIFKDMDDFEITYPTDKEKAEAAALWEECKIKLNKLEAIKHSTFSFLNCLVLAEDFRDFIREMPMPNVYNALFEALTDFSYEGALPYSVSKAITSLLDATSYKADSFLHHTIYDRCYVQETLFRVGDIENTLRNLHPDTAFYGYIQAMGHLQNGNPNEAYKSFEKVLKSTGAIAPSHPYLIFIYGLTLLLADSASAVKKADALTRKKEIREIEHLAILRLMVQMKVHPETDFKEWLKSSVSFQYLKPIERVLIAMVCKCYNYKIENINIYEKEANKIAASGFNVLTMDLANVFDGIVIRDIENENLKIDIKELQEALKMHTFLPKYEIKEDWEIVLNTLMSKFGNQKSTGKTKEIKQEISRISYLVNPKYFSVTPRLQKSKNGGQTWSAGRNIALTTFMKSMPEKTAQDQSISTMVKSYSYGWYGGASYELDGEKVIEALVGHPYVFLESNPELKIEIGYEKLQIEVRETEKGYKVVHNAHKKDGNYQELCVIIQSPQIYKVLKLNKTEIEILNLLDRISVYPKSAGKQLTQLLEALGSKITVVSALLKNSESIISKKGDTKITMQLIPYEEDFTARCYVKPIAGSAPYCTPGKGLEFIATTINGKAVQIERNRKKELANLKEVEEWMQPFDEYHEQEGWTMPMVECLQLLDMLREHADKCLIEWPEGVRFKVLRPMLNASNLKLSVNGMSHWFSVDGEVTIDEKQSMKIGELLKRVREAKGNFIQIGDNEYVALNQQLKKYLASLDHVSQTDKKQLKVSQYNSAFIQDLQNLGAEMNVDGTYNDLVRNLKEADEMKFSIPKMLQADLRDYQKEGYRWLSRLAHWGAGACLADDMGLGKTIQTIALMLSHAKDGASLVIMPTSVLMNWRDEIKKFAPSLNVVILRSAADREEAVRSAGPQDIVLATYGLLPSEEELLTKKKWNIIVLDEAHTIKNKETKTSKVAMQLEGKFRLLLTGTPLQNHLSEIWNLFQFATPGLLTNFTQFSQEFIMPIERDHDKDRQRLLKRMLSPFILRRTKSEVLNELPEKTEITMKIELSDAERALYERFRDEAILNLEDGSTSPIQALAELTKLRQTACNAALVLPKKEAKSIPSSKMEAFLKLVDELQRNHHRALVFSQFTSHLALVEEELKKMDIKYQYLDGSTSPTERIKRVDEFQKGDMPLFLISLKAGGTGLNLTAADYVIHLDPWWNPAIEDQASDRAYRIGQDKPVTVYRLIAENTIEEKIIALHQTKKSLADALLEGSDINHALGKDEILSLLKERDLLL